MTINNKELLHPNIRLLALFYFLSELRLYLPILIIYFAHVTGSYTLGLSLFSVTMLAAALLEIPTGVLSDRMGRRNTVILGAIASAVATVFYAFGATYLLLAVGALCEGLAKALYSGNNDALMHDSLRERGNEKQFAEYSGKAESMNQVAIAIVSVLGGILAFYSYKWVMVLSIIPALVGIYVAYLLREPAVDSRSNEGNIYNHLQQAIRLFWVNKKLRWLSIGSMIGYSQGELGYQFRSAFFATLWPVWAIGIAKALGSVGAALSFWFAGSLIKRYGEFVMVLVSKGYSLVTNITATTFPTTWSPVIMSSNSFFYGSGAIASSTLKQREYSHEQRATMASLDSFSQSVVYSLLAIGVGYIADTWSPAKGILMLQILAFISTVITWTLFRKEK